MNSKDPAPAMLSRILPLLLLAAVAAFPVCAQTPSWGKLATVSGTLNPGSLCVADANGKDLSCPSDAPSLSSLNTSDHIVSGTTGIYVSNTGVINFQANGITFGYFDASGLLIAPGISITTNHGISATAAQFSGDLSTSSTFMKNGDNISTQDSLGNLRYRYAGSFKPMLIARWGITELDAPLYVSATYIQFEDNSNPLTFQHSSINQPLVFNASQGSDEAYVESLRIGPMPMTVGINAYTTPTANLSVSGSTRVTSWTMINANITPTTALEVSGTVSTTTIRLSEGSPCATVADNGNHRMVNGFLQLCRVE